MTDYPSAAEVSQRLAARIEQLCRDLLSAGKRNANYWSVGGTDNSKGASMWVHLSGEKRGHWQDGATGEFGDALDLLAACRYGGSKKDAYAAGLALLGWNVARPETKPAAAPQPAKPANDDADAKKRAYALRLYLEARADIKHTPAWDYLIGRGIDLSILARQPRALRFHAGLRHTESGLTFPALVAGVSGPDGSHVATHRTYLEHISGGWVKARVEKPKLALGVYFGGSIRIWRGASNRPLKSMPPDEPVVIGEGIETCLSIAIACPDLRVLCAISLGNMGSVWLPEQARLVVLAADNDTHPQARAQLQRAVNAHIDAGREVRIARAQFGNDFNDVLTGAA